MQIKLPQEWFPREELQLHKMKNDNRIDGIYVPLKVGDIIYTGRFRNKKTTVKTIGKDEYGMPTVNGKRVLNFRIIKEEKNT